MELQLAGAVTCTSQVMLLLFHKLSRFPTSEGPHKTSEQMNRFFPLRSLFKAKQEHKKKERMLIFLVKGPDHLPSQLLPIMSNTCCSGDGEGRKDKGGGGGKMVCEKVV